MKRHALVLGGGGVSGIAWLNGLLAGLWPRGFHPDKFDLIVGTSAGATAAVQVASGLSPEQLVQRQVDPQKQSRERIPEPALLRAAAEARVEILALQDPAAIRRRRGVLALAAPAPPEAERRAIIASRLPVSDWPRDRLVLVAVDAETGEAVFFDRGSGVDLVDAVAASCAVPGIWPPVTIGARRYIDGGVRSPENADLAAGNDEVLLISPLGDSWAGLPPRDLSTDVEALRSAGAHVLLIQPDPAARAAMGETLDDLLDPRSRERAARAGLAQAAALPGEVLEFLR